MEDFQVVVSFMLGVCRNNGSSDSESGFFREFEGLPLLQVRFCRWVAFLGDARYLSFFPSSYTRALWVPLYWYSESLNADSTKLNSSYFFSSFVR